MAAGYTVAAMNTMILRARQMSLALLVIAVVDHGHLQADYSGATPTTSGLMRLGRDLMRRAGGGADSQSQPPTRVAGRRKAPTGRYGAPSARA
jgi:hypothetical protein